MNRRPANPTSWATTILDRQPFSEADATRIANKVRAALVLLLDGKADPVHFITLGCAVNVASVRAEEISVELVEILAGAGHVLNECQKRHDATGAHGLDGPGRGQLVAGIDAYEAILRASSPAQMQLSEKEVLRRLNMLGRAAA